MMSKEGSTKIVNFMTPHPKGRGNYGVKSVKFKYFLKNLLLKNYWANLNQIWYVASVEQEDKKL